MRVKADYDLLDPYPETALPVRRAIELAGRAFRALDAIASSSTVKERVARATRRWEQTRAT